MEFEIVLNMLNGLLLPNVLPQHSISMPLAIKVRPERFNSLFCWKEKFKVTFSALFFFKVSQYFEIIFRQASEAIQERRNNLLLLLLALVWRAELHAQLVFGLEGRAR
jgi:hypothetical protein